ncbi:DUF6671 family protein [Winogradskyella sp. UBA3174]|uniref:DUF6671 family protein n=1 Tax=Winogradskyella sp. UBA3174 TaxID=1947785 RepID=UPI0025F4D9D1|nr:DUF6671 family protein [Winogradskyella sp. UBA3174]|tara:strand:+ start:26406 stop:27242 length:837 start_codon:yes stop_codon:yes gene_type:complete
MFKGRRLIIATKHNKEQVIAPLLEDALGVTCFVDETFDTDTLGTFSGEIEREQDPINTARLKCLKAMELNNCDIGIASEGSFGAHPSIFFASADDEFLIFIDKKNGLEIIARELSTETNFNGKSIKSEKDLMDFVELTKFPSHALILKKSKEDTEDMVKAITSFEVLKVAFHMLFEKHRSVFAETDMRALYNPSRMLVIEAATKKLVAKIQSFCPECKTPGFGVTDLKKGLPCDLCGLPTKSTLSLIYACQKCQHLNEDFYPNNKKVEDPMYCDFCNP